MIIIISLIASFFYVCLNTFSFWMISSLIATIMKPNVSQEIIQKTNLSINEKLEQIAYQLIGTGSKFDHLEMLCLIYYKQIKT